MIIDYNTFPTSRLDNFKGGDKHLDAKMYADDNVRILHGTLVPGASIGVHTHDDSSEIIYILQGTGHAIIDGQTETVKAGMCHYCPKGSTHTLINDSDSDLVFFAVVPKQ